MVGTVAAINVFLWEITLDQNDQDYFVDNRKKK